MITTRRREAEKRKEKEIEEGGSHTRTCHADRVSNSRSLLIRQATWVRRKRHIRMHLARGVGQAERVPSAKAVARDGDVGRARRGP